MAATALQAPTWQVLVAFQNLPLDDPGLIASVAAPAGTLGLNNVWTDVTPFCESIQVQRGRQHELNSFEAGTATLGLWAATTGNFNPWNTSGAYFPYLDLMTPIQVRATWSGSVFPVITGHVKAWPLYWPDSAIQRAEIDVTDAFALFEAFALYSTGYAEQIIADGAVGYWRLDEQLGSGIAFDSSGNGFNGVYEGTPGLGAAGLLAGDADTAMNTNNGTGWAQLPSNAAIELPSTGNRTIEAWFSTTNTSADLSIWGDTGTVGPVLNGPGLFVNSAGSGFSVNSVNYADGNPHHLVITFALSSFTGTVQVYVDGTLAATNSSLSWETFPLLIGNSGTQGVALFPFIGTVDEFAVYDTILNAATILSHYQLGSLGSVVELSGARINRILNVTGWSAGARAIDAGNSLMEADEPSVGTSILSYTQIVEQSENGFLFMNQQGQVRFIERLAIVQAPYTVTQVTFGDNSGLGELPFEQNPTLALDDLDLWNNVVMQRTGGVAQQAQSATSILSYGPRTFQNTSMLVTTDAEAFQAANWVLNKFQNPILRVSSLILRPNDDQTGALTAGLLGIELMDRVTVNRHTIPGGASEFTCIGLVEGISHSYNFADQDWQVTLALSPADTTQYWILGDTTNGVLGSTTTLAY